MDENDKNAARLYELSDELDYMIEAGQAMAQKNPDRCCAGACCILRDIQKGIKSVAGDIESA